MPEISESKQKVVVSVSPRAGFGGFYSIGRFFPNGQTEVDVTEKELSELKQEQYLAVLSRADAAKLSAPATSADPLSLLSDEERKAVEEFRAKKAQDAAKADAAKADAAKADAAKADAAKADAAASESKRHK